MKHLIREQKQKSYEGINEQTRNQKTRQDRLISKVSKGEETEIERKGQQLRQRKVKLKHPRRGKECTDPNASLQSTKCTDL